MSPRRLVRHCSDSNPPMSDKMSVYAINTVSLPDKGDGLRVRANSDTRTQ